MNTKHKRNAHILAVGKSSNLPTELIFYDCETDEIYENGYFKHPFKLLSCIYCRIDDNANVVKEERFIFDDINEFHAFIYAKCSYSNTLYVIAHNENFDFISAQFMKFCKEYEFDIDSWIFDSNLFSLTTSKHDLEYESNNSSKKRIKALRIHFLDTFNWFKTSVNAMGKTLSLPKLEINFSETSREYLEVYCMRDSEIIQQFFLNYLKFLILNDLGSFGLTTPSQSMKAYKHRFMQDKIYIHTNKLAIKLERDSYHGGRTECFQLGKLPPIVYYLDVNSLYPFVMRNNYFPTKLLGVMNNPSIELIKEQLQSRLLIAECEVIVEEPVFPIYDERLLFPIGNFITTLSTPEIEYAIEHNQLKRVIWCSVYEKAPIFKTYIDFFYDLKRKYKEEDNKIYYTLSKLFMNSLYGKFGQKIEDWMKVENPFEIETARINWYNAEEHRSYIYVILNGQAYLKSSEYEEANDSFVAIASHVTAYARMYMWSIFQRVGLNNIYYTDTDSLMVNTKVKDSIADLLDEFELGKLKIEHELHNAYIFNVKDYKSDELTKKKGVTKKAIQLNENTFKQRQFLKMRSILLQNDISMPISKDVVKTYSNEYKKGVVNEQKRILPYRINNPKENRKTR